MTQAKETRVCDEAVAGRWRKKTCKTCRYFLGNWECAALKTAVNPDRRRVNIASPQFAGDSFRVSVYPGFGCVYHRPRSDDG